MNKERNLIFVVQEHHATHIHWDFRLEYKGVLKSWAVPKGPPLKSGIKRLALEVENHSIEYADFEGEIPEGEYGAGKVKIWDSGKYELRDIEKTSGREIWKFSLYGKRLTGNYALIKTEGKNWIMLKEREK